MDNQPTTKTCPMFFYNMLLRPQIAALNCWLLPFGSWDLLHPRPRHLSSLWHQLLRTVGLGALRGGCREWSLVSGVHFACKLFGHKLARICSSWERVTDTQRWFVFILLARQQEVSFQPLGRNIGLTPSRSVFTILSNPFRPKLRIAALNFSSYPEFFKSCMKLSSFLFAAQLNSLLLFLNYSDAENLTKITAVEDGLLQQRSFAG